MKTIPSKRNVLAPVSVFLASVCLYEASGASITWQPLNEPGVGGKLSSFAVSPHNSQKILAGGDMLGAGVSNDAGATWNSTNIMSAYRAPDGDLYAAVLGSGIYWSPDGNGANWQLRNGTGFTQLPNSGKTVSWVTGKSNNSETLYAALQSWNSGGVWNPGGIYKSVDGGLTWNAANNGITLASDADNASFKIVACAPSDPYILYTGDLNGGGTVYKTTDNAVTWSPVLTTSGINKAYLAGVELEYIGASEGVRGERRRASEGVMCELLTTLPRQWLRRNPGGTSRANAGAEEESNFALCCRRRLECLVGLA